MYIITLLLLEKKQFLLKKSGDSLHRYCINRVIIARIKTLLFGKRNRDMPSTVCANAALYVRNKHIWKVS